MAEDDVEVLADIWYNVGGVFVVSGDLEMAKQAYQTAIGLMPDHTEALNNMAIISYR